MGNDEVFLKPLTSKVKDRKVAVVDIESKSGVCGRCGHGHYGGPCVHGLGTLDPCYCPEWVKTQDKGFSRMFLLGFYDGDTYADFANRPELERHRAWQERHLLPGGAMHTFCDYFFGLDYGDEARRRFQNDRFNVYGHNAGKFDWLFLLPYLIRNSKVFQFEVTSVQARIQRLDVWVRGTAKKSGCWSFYDSISLLPMSLEEVGKKFCPSDVQKKKMDLDAPEDDPAWRVYLKYDCLTLHKALTIFYKLVQEDMKGEIGMTAPATSMKLWRRRFQKKWIRRNPHFKDCEGKCQGCDRLFCRDPETGERGECHGCAHEWVRLAYYGGRTELFESHASFVYYFDINSSYPTSMLEDMPVGRMVETGPLSLNDMVKMRRTHVGFVECEVSIPRDCQIPPLPHRSKLTGKLVFQTGTFSGVWDFDELRLLDHPQVKGRITKVRRTVWYEKAPVFKEMVETLYAWRDKRRKDYNSGLAEVAKLMLNSLYGKFGMNPLRTGLVMVRPGDERPANGWPQFGGFEDDELWEVETVCEAAYIVPQIPAHITTLSRIRLFLGMMEVLRLGGSVKYVDTDSIMCTLPNGSVERFPTGPALGQWKREEPGVRLDGEWVLPKLYQLRSHELSCLDPSCPGCLDHFHDPGCKDKANCPGCAATKQKMKGVGSRGQTLANWLTMRAGGTVSTERVSQHRSMLRESLVVPEPVQSTKSLRTTYDKRVLAPDGTTTPLYTRERRPW